MILVPWRDCSIPSHLFIPQGFNINCGFQTVALLPPQHAPSQAVRLSLRIRQNQKILPMTVPLRRLLACDDPGLENALECCHMHPLPTLTKASRDVGCSGWPCFRRNMTFQPRQSCLRSQNSKSAKITKHLTTPRPFLSSLVCVPGPKEAL